MICSCIQSRDKDHADWGGFSLYLFLPFWLIRNCQLLNYFFLFLCTLMTDSVNRQKRQKKGKYKKGEEKKVIQIISD